VAIGEDGGEGGGEARRYQLRDGNEPGGRGAALLVGVHEHRDPDAPFGAVESRERELDPPQPRVAEDAAEDGAYADNHAHERGSRSATASRMTRATAG
jgi:hypothetical protein